MSPWFAGGGSSPYFGTNPDRRKLDGRKLGLAVRLLLEERMSLRQAADVLGVSHMTLHRALKRDELKVDI
ncbi:MAG: helix-turn-helix domain-containing protein [Candidatus Bilamarchaeaceae archaeon]